MIFFHPTKTILSLHTEIQSCCNHLRPFKNVTFSYLEFIFTKTCLASFFFPRLQSDHVESNGPLLLQDLGHSLHSRERLIQVGETMRADRSQLCKQRWNPLPAAVLRLIGMLFVSAHPLKWLFFRLYLCAFS